MWYAIAAIVALLVIGAMWFTSRASAQAAPSVSDAATSPIQKARDAVAALTGSVTHLAHPFGGTLHTLGHSDGGAVKGV